MIDPNAIAQTYLNIIHQPRSAWTWEAESLGERFPFPKLSKIELRPWVERF